MSKQQSVIVSGGGIGGLAAAQALTQQGIQVLLLEQAHEIGEIGAGIQLGPNAYSALDARGPARPRVTARYSPIA
ncbi:3-hydroxybenzoate 6-hydroxylase 1 [compost metagenome]